MHVLKNLRAHHLKPMLMLLVTVVYYILVFESYSHNLMSDYSLTVLLVSGYNQYMYVFVIVTDILLF